MTHHLFSPIRAFTSLPQTPQAVNSGSDYRQARPFDNALAHAVAITARQLRSHQQGSDALPDQIPELPVLAPLPGLLLRNTEEQFNINQPRNRRRQRRS